MDWKEKEEMKLRILLKKRTGFDAEFSNTFKEHLQYLDENGLWYDVPMILWDAMTEEEKEKTLGHNHDL